MSRPEYYIERNGVPVPCDSMAQWARLTSGVLTRRVARDDGVVPGVDVSTVFLGIDHGFGDDGTPPILYETLVFGGPLGGEMNRYATRPEALAGHAAMVARVKAAGAESPAPTSEKGGA